MIRWLKIESVDVHAQLVQLTNPCLALMGDAQGDMGVLELLKSSLPQHIQMRGMWRTKNGTSIPFLERPKRCLFDACEIESPRPRTISVHSPKLKFTHG